MTKKQKTTFINLLKGSSFHNFKGRTGTIIKVYNINNIIIQYSDNQICHASYKDFKNKYYLLSNQQKQNQILSILFYKPKPRKPKLVNENIMIPEIINSSINQETTIL